jgi:site-specific DNA recombinase
VSKRAAIYCRVSTSKQEDNYSLASQLENCRRFAQDKGYECSDQFTYQEVASGFTLDRPKLTNLRDALRRGQIDAVIVNSFDRWASTDKDSYRLYTELDEGEASLESVTQGKFEDSPTGRLVMNAYTLGRELWLEDHKERTHRGRRGRVESGKLIPGNRPPYGYLWADDTKGRLIPNPATAPIVQRIFHEIAAGATARGMCLRLTEEGVPAPMGGATWAQPTVSALVRRPVYYGEARAFRYRAIKTKNGKPSVAMRPEAEQVVIPDAAPALISKDVADQALQRLTRNRSVSIRNNRDPEAAMLRGGIGVCGYCGKALIAINDATKGVTIYRCNQRNRDRYGCPSFGINAEKLDRPVWSRVEGILNDPAIISAELERLRVDDPTVGDIKGVDRALADIERKQGNLISRLADVDDDDIAALVQNQLKQLAKQRKQFEEERQSLTRQRAAWAFAQTQFNEIETWCKNVAANVQDLTYDQKRLALEALGVEVRLWGKEHNPRWQMQTNIHIQSSC